MKHLHLKHRLFSLSIFIVVAVFAVWPSLRDQNESPRPEIITLSTGSTKRVANGRAQLWLGEMVAVSDSRGRLNAGVEFEITCDGETFYAEAVSDAPARPICGCYVRLLETFDTHPPLGTARDHVERCLHTKLPGRIAGPQSRASRSLVATPVRSTTNIAG